MCTRFHLTACKVYAYRLHFSILYSSICDRVLTGSAAYTYIKFTYSLLTSVLAANFRSIGQHWRCAIVKESSNNGIVLYRIGRRIM